MAQRRARPAVRTLNPATNTAQNVKFIDELEAYHAQNRDTYADQTAAFMKFVPRQRLTDFLSRYETFRKVLPVQGSVVDCGVYKGRSLMTYAQLSAILEPMNYQRQIIGFDTFSGNTPLSPEDRAGTHPENRAGGYRAEAEEDLKRCIALFDKNRFLGHIPKVILVKGDITTTAPRYVAKNPHLVVSLLSLDVSLFEPTRAALKAFLPRMPKGAVITFSEMNCSDFTGEVQALVKEVGIPRLRIRRHPFDTVASFAVLE